MPDFLIGPTVNLCGFSIEGDIASFADSLVQHLRDNGILLGQVRITSDGTVAVPVRLTYMRLFCSSMINEMRVAPTKNASLPYNTEIYFMCDIYTPPWSFLFAMKQKSRYAFVRGVVRGYLDTHGIQFWVTG